MTFNKDRELPPNEFSYDLERQRDLEGPLQSEPRIDYQLRLASIPIEEIVKYLESKGMKA